MKQFVTWLQLFSIAILLLKSGISQDAVIESEVSDEMMYQPNPTEDLLEILISDVKHKRTFCRSSNERRPNDIFLPKSLFNLDSCARCYGYILDVPAFFEPLKKWNRTEITIQVPAYLTNESLSYNVTVLRNDYLNITVSTSSFTLRLLIYSTPFY